jgi:hypothetical protein
MKQNWILPADSQMECFITPQGEVQGDGLHRKFLIVACQTKASATTTLRLPFIALGFPLPTWLTGLLRGYWRFGGLPVGVGTHIKRQPSSDTSSAELARTIRLFSSFSSHFVAESSFVARVNS